MLGILCWNFQTIYGGYEPNMNRVVVPARQATQPGGIGSLESILRLLKSLKFGPLPWNKKSKETRNSVPNHSTEEKTTRNSVPSNTNGSKLSKFRSEAFRGRKHARNSVCCSSILVKHFFFIPLRCDLRYWLFRKSRNGPPRPPPPPPPNKQRKMKKELCMGWVLCL